MSQVRAFRERLDVFQNIVWRVEHTILSDGEPTPTNDERYLWVGDTLSVYEHLYSSTKLFTAAYSVLLDYLPDLTAKQAAQRISEPMYVLNIYVEHANVTTPFSAVEYLRDEQVQMGGPFANISTPKMCLSFHDDVNRVKAVVQGGGDEKKLYLVVLRDDVNGVTWSEEKAQALRTLKFTEAKITEISAAPLSAYWLITTVQQPSLLSSRQRAIPEDAQGTATGGM